MEKMNAADLFDGLDGEQSQVQRVPTIKQSAGLVAIVEGFKELARSIETLSLPIAFASRRYPAIYETFAQFVPKEYASSDITSFLLEPVDAAVKYHLPYREFYASALINKCAEPTITLITLHLETLLNFVGVCNESKRIEVHGDLFEGAGACMSAGSLIIKGNAADGLGRKMNGGEIIVERNVGHYAGEEMRGGKITITGSTGSKAGFRMHGGELYVHGKADWGVGDDMTGGTIHLLGPIDEQLGTTKGGNIYHKGKQIVKDGKKL